MNKNYLETDANEKCKEDETNDADKVKNDGDGSVDTHEMDPDEV